MSRMTPKIRLVCFADDKFAHSRDRLIASARLQGIDIIHSFAPHDYLRTNFYLDNKAILDQPRGCGYWLWKPYFIREVLRVRARGRNHSVS